jgi:hypothetical protein
MKTKLGYRWHRPQGPDDFLIDMFAMARRPAGEAGP